MTQYFCSLENENKSSQILVLKCFSHKSKNFNRWRDEQVVISPNHNLSHSNKRQETTGAFNNLYESQNMLSGRSHVQKISHYMIPLIGNSQKGNTNL